MVSVPRRNVEQMDETGEMVETGGSRETGNIHAVSILDTENAWDGVQPLTDDPTLSTILLPHHLIGNCVTRQAATCRRIRLKVEIGRRSSTHCED